MQQRKMAGKGGWRALRGDWCRFLSERGERCHSEPFPARFPCNQSHKNTWSDLRCDYYILDGVAPIGEVVPLLCLILPRVTFESGGWFSAPKEGEELEEGFRRNFSASFFPLLLLWWHPSFSLLWKPFSFGEWGWENTPFPTINKMETQAQWPFQVATRLRLGTIPIKVHKSWANLETCGGTGARNWMRRVKICLA